MSFVPAIAKKLANYESPSSFGSKLRRRRIGPLIKMIDTIYAAHGSVRILDIGGTRDYWNMFPAELLAQNSVHITIVNIPGSKLPPDDSTFTFADGDGCNLSEHAANSFDIVHSNSVIEHVGDWSRMCSFADEVRRIAPNYFVQTPYFWFPIEPHFMTPLFHWLPEPIRVSLILRFNLGQCPRRRAIGDAVLAIQSARLLDKKMYRFLFPDAYLYMERFLLLPKSLIAIRSGKVQPIGNESFE